MSHFGPPLGLDYACWKLPVADGCVGKRGFEDGFTLWTSRANVCIRVHMCAYVRMYAYACTCARMYAYVCMRVHMCAYVRM